MVAFINEQDPRYFLPEDQYSTLRLEACDELKMKYAKKLKSKPGFRVSSYFY